MNNVQLIGNLVRDPELRYTPTGTAIGKFTLALNRPKKDGQDQQADFINITTFGKLAENCANYLAKGRKAAVEGRLNSGSYTNKDGVKVYTVDVIANNVEFLSSHQQANTNDNDSSEEYYPGFSEADSEDVPF